MKDKLYATIWKTGNSYVITIPPKLMKFEGIKQGDTLKVWFEKEKKEGDTDAKKDINNLF